MRRRSPPSALAGFTTLGRNAPLRVMVLLLTVQTGMFGAVQVFIVVASIDLLGLGEGGVGYLNAAIGVGAFVGAVVALTLTGAKRLSPAFLAGLAMTGLPLVVLGVWPEVGVALVVFAVIGLANSYGDVAGLTLDPARRSGRGASRGSSASSRCCGSRPWESARRSRPR